METASLTETAAIPWRVWLETTSGRFRTQNRRTFLAVLSHGLQLQPAATVDDGSCAGSTPAVSAADQVPFSNAAARTSLPATVTAMETNSTNAVSVVVPASPPATATASATNSTPSVCAAVTAQRMSMRWHLRRCRRLHRRGTPSVCAGRCTADADSMASVTMSTTAWDNTTP